MKVLKEELIKEVDELVNDTDIAIKLIEDITDSFVGENAEIEDLKIENEKLKNDLIELKEKYKSRFFSTEKKDDENDEIKENIIDVKEI